MSELRTKRDGIRAAKEAAASYEQQVSSLREQLSQVQSELSDCRKSLDANFKGIVAGLLNDLPLDQEKIEALSKEIGMIQLPAIWLSMQKDYTDNQQMLKNLEENPNFKNRDMLIGGKGEYTLKEYELNEAASAIKERLLMFKMAEKSFAAVYDNYLHPPKPRNWWEDFIYWLSGRKSKFEQHQKVVRDHFNMSPFQSLNDLCLEYEDLKNSQSNLQEAQKINQKNQQKIADLSAQYDKLKIWFADFSHKQSSRLNEVVYQYLSSCEDLKTLRQVIRADARLIVSTCFALKEKVKYFNDIIRYLRQEISDREDRVSAIQRVERKWRKKPSDRLKGDKAKWLIDTPAAKAQATTKQVNWIGSMHHNIYCYDDYGLFDAMLDAQMMFLAYDIFAHSGDMRMPYEGFSGQIIGDMSAYREEYGAGPNMSEFAATAGADLAAGEAAMAIADGMSEYSGADDSPDSVDMVDAS